MPTTTKALPVVVVGLLLLTGCSGHRTSAAPWNLRGPAVGAQLHLRVGIGSSSCDELTDIEVREDAQEVHLTAVVERTDEHDCSSDYGTVDRDVQLQAPLGTRRLTGCRPKGPLTGGDDFGGDETESTCFETAPAVAVRP